MEQDVPILQPLLPIWLSLVWCWKLAIAKAKAYITEAIRHGMDIRAIAPGL